MQASAVSFQFNTPRHLAPIGRAALLRVPVPPPTWGFLRRLAPQAPRILVEA
jgi:hypothetical protein